MTITGAWNWGLSTPAAVIFDPPPATVEHEACAAFGAPACVYRISWAGADTAAGLLDRLVSAFAAIPGGLTRAPARRERRARDVPR